MYFEMICTGELVTLKQLPSAIKDYYLWSKENEKNLQTVLKNCIFMPEGFHIIYRKIKHTLKRR